METLFRAIISPQPARTHSLSEQSLTKLNIAFVIHSERAIVRVRWVARFWQPPDGFQEVLATQIASIIAVLSSSEAVLILPSTAIVREAKITAFHV
jgi:hypothetical protein